MNTITSCAEDFASAKTTSRALTEQYLRTMETHNPAINAYLATNSESALAQADAADARLKAGENITPLTGVPLAIKDVLHCPHLDTTCASQFLAGYRPPFVATAVQRLLDAGAVVLGKTNMDEFAMGASNEHSSFGPVKNPWDHTRVPGGSSGGSAAAVAADLCAAALGTDTGGSIRQPAALTGTVGLKPTYGRVSRYGLVAFASSLDQIGPMTKTVQDSALLLQYMAGHDPADSTSRDLAVPDFVGACGQDISGLRLGVPQEYFAEGIHAEVETSVREALAHLESQGAELVPISLPHTKYAVPAYYIIAPAEASANLARFDGVRFGQRSDSQGIRDLYNDSRRAGFGPEVIRRIIVGTYVLSSGYYDAYYLKAQKVRRLITQDFENVFTEVDAIVSPTTPYAAFEIGGQIDDPVAMYLADICTCPANLAGLPGISVPCGFTSDKLPIGLQVIGKSFDEETVLRVAHHYEQTRGFEVSLD